MSLPPLASVADAPPAGSGPLVSIGVPAYRRPKLLRETLSSLEAQTGGHDFEVVVCDDGGLPETAGIVAEFPAARFRLAPTVPTLGAVGNWNRCLQCARGQWVMVLHEDDTLYPWYLDVATPHLRAGRSAVCPQVVQGPAPPPRRRPVGTPAGVRGYPPRLFLKSSFTPFPGVLFPRELGLRLGGFDPRWGPLADYEFWYRLAAAGPVARIDAVAAFYRVAPGQWTEGEWPRMLRLAHLLRLQIAREQLPRSPRLGRWLARFFTARTARSYARRFRDRPAGLARAEALGRIPLGRLPSGWVWQLLQWIS